MTLKICSLHTKNLLIEATYHSNVRTGVTCCGCVGHLRVRVRIGVRIGVRVGVRIGVRVGVRVGMTHKLRMISPLFVYIEIEIEGHAQRK